MIDHRTELKPVLHPLVHDRRLYDNTCSHPLLVAEEKNGVLTITEQLEPFARRILEVDGAPPSRPKKSAPSSRT